jgi:hypothetical protein
MSPKKEQSYLKLRVFNHGPSFAFWCIARPILMGLGSIIEHHHCNKEKTMKLLPLIAGLVICASPALAADALLIKTSSPGFVMPDWVRTETCKVYQDKVVIERSFGLVNEQGFATTETINVTISDGITAILARAAEEKVKETRNMICDLPGLNVAAVENGKEFVLFSSGGCGSPRKEREGSATRMLMDLLGHYCKAK